MSNSLGVTRVQVANFNIVATMPSTHPPHRKFVRMASNDVHAWIQFRSLTSPIQRDSEFRIGRSIGSDLRLFEETSISREHSVVTSHNGKLEVTDLNSRNGTRVNGRLVKVPTPLHHRDVIKAGEVELMVLLELQPGSRGSTAEIPLMS